MPQKEGNPARKNGQKCKKAGTLTPPLSCFAYKVYISTYLFTWNFVQPSLKNALI